MTLAALVALGDFWLVGMNESLIAGVVMFVLYVGGICAIMATALYFSSDE